jgi:hypothetical protein
MKDKPDAQILESASCILPPQEHHARTRSRHPADEESILVTQQEKAQAKLWLV